MRFFQIGILLFLFFVVTNGAFFCYHGEGIGTKYVKKTCPSKICIIFNSACGAYAATTCYNDQTPMKIVNMFKTATFYYNKSPQSISYGYCTTSECNREMGNLTNPVIIQLDPLSFDSMLSPSVKKEEPRKKLQNGIKLPSGIGANETFKFVGQTFKTSKAPWLALSCIFKNDTSMKFQINFDLKQSKLISKTVTVVGATQKIKQFNETWTNSTKPGGKVTVLLKNNNPGYEITVNGVTVLKFFNDDNIKLINLATYGGAWTMSGASIIDTNGQATPLKMLPTFYSDLIPINAAKLKGNLDNLKLNAQEFYLYPDEKEYRFSMDTVDPNFMTSYEFRISPNPQSDLIKIQFQNMPTPPTSHYALFWKREKSVWSSTDIAFFTDKNRCDEYRIGIAINGANFYCNDKFVHNITFPNFGTLFQYKIQNFGPDQPSPCPKVDPFTHRLLGRMPRITDYSF